MSEERLAEFEQVCEELWPAVRFFGLCGAAPEYVLAVEKLGILMGKWQGSAVVQQVADQAASITREQVIAEIAGLVGTSSEVRAMTGVGLQKKLFELISRVQ